MKFSIQRIYVLIFLWLLAGINNSLAQATPAEKLNSQIASSSENNNKVDLMNQLAEELLNSDPSQSINEAQAALQIAQKLSYKKGEAEAFSLIGVGNYKIDKSGNAKEFLDKASAKAAEIKDESRIVFCKYWYGRINESQGQFNKALEGYQAGIELAQKIGDKKNLARCLDGKASIFETLNDQTKAKELYEQSLAVAKEINFKSWIPVEIFSLGNLAMNKGNYDEAIQLFNESLALSDEVNNLNNKASCMQQLAVIYLNKNDLKKAIDYTQQAMEIFQSTGALSSYSFSQLLLSTILLRDNQTAYAIELAQKAYNTGKATKELTLQRDAATILYQAYFKKGDKSTALDYHIELAKLAEIIQSNELTKNLTKMELQDNFEKEKELDRIKQSKKDAELNAQIKTQQIIRNASLVALGLLLIIAGLAYYAFLQKKKDNILIEAEKKKTDELLLNILPADVAEELKEKGKSKARSYELVSVLFADIRNFTQAGEQLSPQKLVDEIDIIFRAFDDIVTKHDVEKIKTIGDAYLCAGGLPKENKSNPHQIISAALEMQRFMEELKKNKLKTGETYFEIRIGVHTGPLVAGIVGMKKFAYDIWGDTVNIAARMEQSSEVGRVNITAATYELVKDKFNCTYRGKMEAKNKGLIDMYFVDHEKS